MTCYPLRILEKVNMNKDTLRRTTTSVMLRLETNIGQRSFSYQEAKTWNNLKTETKTATSLQSFKKLL